MLTYLLNLFRKEEGQSLAEYALILVLVSIAAIAAMTTLGTDISGTFTKVSTTLSS
jgi:pilus assembly protein Flp/PilA